MSFFHATSSFSSNPFRDSAYKHTHHHFDGYLVDVRYEYEYFHIIRKLRNKNSAYINFGVHAFFGG